MNLFSLVFTGLAVMQNPAATHAQAVQTVSVATVADQNVVAPPPAKNAQAAPAVVAQAVQPVVAAAVADENVVAQTPAIANPVVQASSITAQPSGDAADDLATPLKPDEGMQPWSGR